MSAPAVARIAVTPRSLSADGHPALAELEAAGFELVYPAPGRMPTADEQRAALADCVGYLAGVEPITGDILDRAPRLRVISRNGVGTDAVDLAAAAERGITVTTTGDANAQGVAELTLALILASGRAIPAQDAALRQGEWRRRRGRELAGRTLGVIGCGRIGSRVAALGRALGMRVLRHDAAPGAGDTPLPRLLAESDVLTLHCPPPAGGPLVDAAFLDAVRPGACLVNTARATLIDPRAVRAALDDGRLGGYATDVFEVEPPADRDLLAHPLAVSTPHIGGFTEESVDRATRAAVDNLLQALSGARDG
ncbi:NAD(P)-dependent oxidoreductase [Streptomyces sp. HUAS MG91]|uniref:NAD(P)-dependent oxidoreductase n=1 Tax=Streptomyces tabacisoli TaxID=3156398 RepID=A0AAU8J509_9ACTN